MIRIEISSNWAEVPPRIWDCQPDDVEWPFFQAHTMVGDIVTITNAGGQFVCFYRILDKGPVNEP